MGVLGPVLPHFDELPPAWVVAGRFCERQRYVTGHVIKWAESRTGNVLFRLSILEGMTEPFRPAVRQWRRGHRLFQAHDIPRARLRLVRRGRCPRNSPCQQAHPLWDASTRSPQRTEHSQASGPTLALHCPLARRRSGARCSPSRGHTPRAACGHETFGLAIRPRRSSVGGLPLSPLIRQGSMTASSRS